MNQPSTSLGEISIEDLSLALGDDEFVGLTLTTDRRIVLSVDNDGRDAALTLDLTSARAVHEALGHLLWRAE